jgi:hypothetical protein
MPEIAVCTDNTLSITNNKLNCDSWAVIEYLESPASFDPAMLDAATLSSAFSAGFILVASTLLIGIGLRVLLDFIRR